jgi:hypothetical protein
MSKNGPNNQIYCVGQTATCSPSRLEYFATGLDGQGVVKSGLRIGTLLYPPCPAGKGLEDRSPTWN